MVKNVLLNLLKFSTLCLFVLTVLIIVFPHADIKINVASINYEKFWKGPNLEDLTKNKYKKKFDLILGSDFTESKETKIEIGYTGEQNNPIIAAKVLSDRLKKYGLPDAEIFVQDDDPDVIILKSTEKDLEALYKNLIISQPGSLDIVGKSIYSMNQNIPELEGMPEQNQLTSLGIDMSRILGAKAEKTDSGYAVRVGLNKLQSTMLTSQIMSYSGIALSIDGQEFGIDSEDLSSEYKSFGSIKTLRIYGLSEDKQARLLASLVSNPLKDYTFTEVESNSIAPVISSQLLKDIFIVLSAILFIIIIFLAIVFKYEGMIADISLLVFLGLLLSAFKILSITLDIYSLITSLLLISIFTSLLVSSLFKSREIIGDLKFEQILFEKKHFGNLEKIFISVILLSFAFALISPFSIKLIMLTVFIGFVLIWFIFRAFVQYLRFCLSIKI